MVIQINYFPKEMLIEIFKQIDNPKTLFKILTVCKLWKTLLEQNQNIWLIHLSEEDRKNKSVVLNPQQFLKNSLVLESMEVHSPKMKKKVDNEIHRVKKVEIIFYAPSSPSLKICKPISSYTTIKDKRNPR